MKTISIAALPFIALLVAGCRVASPVTSLPRTNFAADNESHEPSALSLFPSDQAVLGDEAVERALSTKLLLPLKARLGMVRFPDPGRTYWRDEDYVRLQEAQIETLSKALLDSGQAADAVLLPSLMTPTRASIPILRESAVRMQVDLLLILRIRSESYSKFRAFAKDKVKAHSTCELVLLDIRTGLVPFTRVVTRDRLELQAPADLDLLETTRRAEQGAATEALNAAAQHLVDYLKSAPRREN